MSIGKIVHIAAAGETRLDIGWDDGRKAGVNLSGVIQARKNLAPLADPAEFAQAELSADGWSVEWPYGIDFGAHQLRRWADEA